LIWIAFYVLLALAALPLAIIGAGICLRFVLWLITNPKGRAIALFGAATAAFYGLISAYLADWERASIACQFSQDTCYWGTHGFVLFCAAVPAFLLSAFVIELVEAWRASRESGPL
jgi:hypothetical protein